MQMQQKNNMQILIPPKSNPRRGVFTLKTLILKDERRCRCPLMCDCALTIAFTCVHRYVHVHRIHVTRPPGTASSKKAKPVQAVLSPVKLFVCVSMCVCRSE